MELMQLEMFVAVVEEGSVRRASERVCRTQPAVSIAVRKLEEEFGAPLFDRSKRHSFRLTHAGESLYGYAKRMLSLRTEATSQLKCIACLQIGRLSIGANESVSLNLLPKLAHRFLECHPGVHLELRCDRSENLLEDLKARRLDVAMVSFRPDDEELDSSFFVEDELVLVTGPNNCLARKTTVKFEDLRDTPVLMMDVSQHSPWHQRVSDAYLRHQIAFPLQVKSAPIGTIKKMIGFGQSVAFLPRMCVGDEVARGDLAIVPIDGFREVRSVWLVRRWAMQSEVTSAFITFARSSREESGSMEDVPVETDVSRPGRLIAVHRRG